VACDLTNVSGGPGSGLLSAFELQQFMQCSGQRMGGPPLAGAAAGCLAALKSGSDRRQDVLLRVGACRHQRGGVGPAGGHVHVIFYISYRPRLCSPPCCPRTLPRTHTSPAALASGLAQAGHDAAVPTVWVLEGLIGYFTTEDGLQLLHVRRGRVLGPS
jgi:hypothetical protein